MDPAFVHAQHVCAYLEKDQAALQRCVAALRSNEDGQLALSQGRSKAALDHFLKAEAGFTGLTPATFLLGITQADIAAAYANMEEWQKAVAYARAAIEITKQEKAFAESEANAHMTLANALGITGDREGARQHYDHAERIYSTFSNAEEQLDALNRNREIVLAESQKSERSWWKFWE